MEISTHGNVKHFSNPFECLSSEAYYWLGWIFSDGCIQSRGHSHYVYLACRDIEIIEAFKNFCGNRAKIHNFTYITPISKETKVMYRVIINSQELVSYFANTYGIIGKKADSMNPNIEINWDLLRGAYDGDGSFKKGVVLTSKSEEWINKIARFYDSLNLHYTIVQDSAYRIAIYKKADIRRVYHYLYDNSILFLQRKKEDLSRLARE